MKHYLMIFLSIVALNATAKERLFFLQSDRNLSLTKGEATGLFGDLLSLSKTQANEKSLLFGFKIINIDADEAEATIQLRDNGFRWSSVSDNFITYYIDFKDANVLLNMMKEMETHPDINGSYVSANKTIVCRNDFIPNCMISIAR